MKIIAVAGASDSSGVVSEVAYRVGHSAASRGFAVLTGGLSGVMEQAMQGARDAGGLTIGVIPSYDKSTANRFCDIVIPSGLGHARNILVASSGDICVSVGGGTGTASEISIAAKLGKPVISFEPPFPHEGGYTDKDTFFIKLNEMMERL